MTNFIPEWRISLVNRTISVMYFLQKKVFNDVGQGILDNAWKGFNTSLFAYGQTGSGKSWSIIGYGANKGKYSYPASFKRHR